MKVLHRRSGVQKFSDGIQDCIVAQVALAENRHYQYASISKESRMDQIGNLPGLVADLAAGRLLQILPKHAVSAAPLNAVYLRGHNRVPRVRAFIDFLGDRFARPPYG